MIILRSHINWGCIGVDIIDDDFMVCTDCLMIIVNDDATGLDYSMDEEEAAEREH
ncbi:hypothetical protein [Halomonas sp. 25-S5]|uniref:hypothetical protein n=1 Tax=Halomonas sp. 25-S5 TaxID=2994065 RepID=UPI002469810A|nr:hypothetical protein [Halomonas sp. 25-S5]